MQPNWLQESQMVVQLKMSYQTKLLTTTRRIFLGVIEKCIAECSAASAIEALLLSNPHDMRHMYFVQ